MYTHKAMYYSSDFSTNLKNCTLTMHFMHSTNLHNYKEKIQGNTKEHLNAHSLKNVLNS